MAALCLFWLAPAPASAAELLIDIAGVRPDGGTIMLGLYDTAAAFDRALELYENPGGFTKDTGRVLGAAIRADTGIRRSTLNGIKSGSYAVILFHDANQDGRLDKNIFGVPTEGFGFSNNAIGFLGPPNFEDAAVTVPDGKTTIRIDMMY